MRSGCRRFPFPAVLRRPAYRSGCRSPVLAAANQQSSAWPTHTSKPPTGTSAIRRLLLRNTATSRPEAAAPRLPVRCSRKTQLCKLTSYAESSKCMANAVKHGSRRSPRALRRASGRLHLNRVVDLTRKSSLNSHSIQLKPEIRSARLRLFSSDCPKGNSTTGVRKHNAGVYIDLN